MTGVDGGSGAKYRYIRDIADGGMGTVSLAVREEGPFRRVYAIKRLRPQYRLDDKVRAMFLEEARIAGLLHHPNAVSVVDVGEDDEGPYLVMDYVQGVSLSELLTDARAKHELVPLQVCVRVLKEVAAGLHAAHELVGHDGQKLDLVHRDVSPQNILVGYDGLSRLSDFGIAKAVGRQDRTNTGILKGKVGYFSPEQLHFQKPTQRSDLFSLGIVFFELLSAQRLYAGQDDGEVARAILKDEPPDIDDVRSDVHPMLVELMYRMLAKEPEHRPQNAQEVVERLDAVLSELVAQEGSRSVADYVMARFEGRRASQQAELDQLTANVELHVRPSKPPRVARSVLGLALAAAIAVALSVWSLRPTPEASLRDRLSPSSLPPASPPAAASAAPIAEAPSPPLVEAAAEAAPKTATRKRTKPRKAPRTETPAPETPAPEKSNAPSLGVMTWEGTKK